MALNRVAEVRPLFSRKQRIMRDLFTKRAIQILEDNGERLDANETAFLDRELVQIRTKVLKVEYPDLIGRTLIPMATDISSSTETYLYKVWDRAGRAKVGANDSDDAPRIDVTGKEYTGRIYPIIASYGWGLNEMREAMRTGTPLADMRVMAARAAIEDGIDGMLAVGHTGSAGETNLLTRGLINNPFVADGVGAANSRVQALGNWTAATSVATILGELNGLVSKVVTDSKTRFRPDTVVLPPSRYNVLAQKMVGVDNDTSILGSFLKNNPYIKSIEQWFALEDAGVGGKDRAVVYRKDSLVLEGIVPLEFEQLPPQARNYEFVVPCLARSGGVKIYQPSAVIYGDFADS